MKDPRASSQCATRASARPAGLAPVTPTPAGYEIPQLCRWRRNIPLQGTGKELFAPA